MLKSGRLLTLALALFGMLTVFGCGGGGGGAMPGGPPATTATLKLYSDFALTDTVVAGLKGAPTECFGGYVDYWTNPPTASQFSLGFWQPTGAMVRMAVSGNFSLPNSLAVDQATGTVNAITETRDGVVIFSITGLKVALTDLIATTSAGDCAKFWRVIAGGAAKIVGVNGSTTSTASNLSCGTDNTGTTITLTNTATPIQSFLMACDGVVSGPPPFETLNVYADLDASQIFKPSADFGWGHPPGLDANLTDSTKVVFEFYGNCAIDCKGIHMYALTLHGELSIPSGGLTTASIAGTTGIVNAIEVYDSTPNVLQTAMPNSMPSIWFRVSGVSIDAASLIGAVLAQDDQSFWHLIATGIPNLAGVARFAPTVKLLCPATANAPGGSVSLSDTPRPVAALLASC